MRLTWQPYNDPIFGPALELAGLPRNMVAVARYSDGGYGWAPRYVANAWIGRRYLVHRAATLHSAIDRLNRDIARRSVELLGVDAVTFEVATEVAAA